MIPAAAALCGWISQARMQSASAGGADLPVQDLPGRQYPGL